MFDWIQIDNSLFSHIPDLENRGVMEILNGKNFQTDCLDSCLDQYKIGADKRLQKQTVKFVINDNPIQEDNLGKRWNPPMVEMESNEWVFADYTGSISAYNNFTDPKTGDEIWIEFYMVIVHGVMWEITLEKYQVQPAEDIAIRKKKWKALMEVRENDRLYQFCLFLSLKIVHPCINLLQKFDTWIRSYQPK